MAVSNVLEVDLCTAGATQTFGASLAEALEPGDVLALKGDLGAGKTTLTQGLALGLGIDEDVLSPTFALMSEYRHGRLQLLHVDAYRLNGAAEADHLGLDDYLDAGWVLVIEWPENIGAALPPDVLEIQLDHKGEGREAHIRANGPRSRRIMERWHIARSGD